MNILMKEDREYTGPWRRDKLLPVDGTKEGFLEEVMLEQF